MTQPKPPWVKWYADKFLSGIVGLDAEEIGVYAMLLNLIYDRGGPVDEDIDRLAARCRMRPTSFRKVLDALQKQGKLLRADGVISNPRAERELETRSKVVEKWRENLSAGDVKQNGKSNENNDDKSPSAAPNNPAPAPVEREREKERKKERAAAPPQPRPPGRTKGTRIPVDWKLTNELLLYARSKGLTDRESKHEAEKFVAHWRQAAGDRGVKLDWDATWQSWVMRTAERLNREPAPVHENRVGPADYSREEWIKIIEMWRVTGNWHPMHGPAPGNAGCLAPKDLVNPG